MDSITANVRFATIIGIYIITRFKSICIKLYCHAAKEKPRKRVITLQSNVYM